MAIGRGIGIAALSLFVGTSTCFAQAYYGRAEIPTATSFIFGKSPMLIVTDYWQWQNPPAQLPAEEPALARATDRVRRVGSVLVLKIDDDRMLQLFDLPYSWSEGGASVHRFEGWLSGARQYVVSVSCFECHMTYLIDARDARTMLVPAPPVLSPSGLYGISTDRDWAFGSAWPSLIDFRSGRPALLAIPEERKCGDRIERVAARPNPVWLDDSQVRFEGSYSHWNHGDYGQILRIIDGKAEWQC
jgi:hypothetical protein